MSAALRALRHVVAASFRASPGRSLLSIAEIGSAGVTACVPLAVGTTIDAVVSGNPLLMLLSVAALTVCFAGAQAASVLGLHGRISQFEAVGDLADQDIAAALSSGGTVDHLHDAAQQDQVALLQQQRGVLGLAFNKILVNAANLTQSGVAVAIAVTVDWRLLFLAVAAVPGLLLLPKWESMVTQAESGAASDARRSRDLIHLAGDRAARLEARMYDARSVLRARTDAAVSRWRSRLRRVDDIRLLFTSVDALFQLVVAAGILILIAQDVAGGRASAGTLAIAVLSIQTLRGVVFSIGYATSSFGDVLRVLVRFGRLMPALDGGSAVSEDGGVSLEGVTYTYPGKERPVLDGVSVTIPHGSFVMVVGENGSGKSTLGSVLLGLLTPQAGRRLLPSTRTAVLQAHMTFEHTVFESVDLGRGHTRERVSAAVAEMGAEVSLEQQLGERWASGTAMSDGQNQRIAIARGLLAPAALTVLDEPTAALDPIAEARMFELLTSTARARRAQGRTTVLISHRFAVVEDADLILVMRDGRVVQAGAHAALIEQPGDYARLLATAAHLSGLPPIEPRNMERGDEDE